MSYRSLWQCHLKLSVLKQAHGVGVDSGKIIFYLATKGFILGSIMPTLVIYTQPNCSYCHEVKEFLNKNNIPFEEKDITKDRAAWDELVNKYKARATPLVVYGDKTLLGFNPDELRKLLGKELMPAK